MGCAICSIHGCVCCAWDNVGNREVRKVTALIFLVVGVAMIVAVAGHRALALGLFGVSFVTAALWLRHHMDSVLNLSL
jgi:hypothetical protein